MEMKSCGIRARRVWNVGLKEIASETVHGLGARIVGGMHDG